MRIPIICLPNQEEFKQMFELLYTFGFKYHNNAKADDGYNQHVQDGSLDTFIYIEISDGCIYVHDDCRISDNVIHLNSPRHFIAYLTKYQIKPADANV